MTFRNTFFKAASESPRYPSEIPDLFARYDVSKLSGLAEFDVVSSLADQSGNGRDIEAGPPPLSGGNYLKRRPGQPPALRHGEGGGYELDAALNTTGDITILAVFKVLNQDTINMITSASDVSASNATPYWLSLGDGSADGVRAFISWRQGASVLKGSRELSPRAYHLVAARREASGPDDFIDVSVDGLLEIDEQTNNRGTGSGTTPILANRIGGSANGCEIVEIVYYLRALTDAEIATLTDYFYAKYGPELSTGVVSLVEPNSTVLSARGSLVEGINAVAAPLVKIPHLVAWYDASVPAVSGGFSQDLDDGDPAQEWRNHYQLFSAFAENLASQADVYAAPIFKVNRRSGLPAFTFDGSRFLGVTESILPFIFGSLTVFVVFKATAPGTILGAGSAPYQFNAPVRLRVSDYPTLDVEYASAGAQEMLPGPVLSFGDFYVATYSRLVGASREAEIRLNGISTTLSPTLDPSWSPGGEMRIGDNAYDRDFFSGDVFEIAMYARRLTTREIVAVEQYLMHKYA